MKTLAFITLALFVLQSCREVTFPETQPAEVASLTEIPKQLQGSFQFMEKDDTDSDTVIIDAWGYHFTDKNGKDWLGRGSLGDSLVMKSYQGYYFVNFRVGDQWVLRLVKHRPDGIEVMAIDFSDESKRDELLKKLKKKMKVKEIKKENDTYYQIKPTKAQLMELIGEGFFSSTILTRIG